MSSTAIARPQAQTGNAFIKTFYHADMPTFTAGDRVKFGSADQLLAAVTGADALSLGGPLASLEDEIAGLRTDDGVAAELAEMKARLAANTKNEG